VVWQWDNSDPFGNNVPNQNPNGAGTFSFNLRFPGQYADQETNTHYNISRDYNPAIGRYVQSDPIGLMGGINTYTYVRANPLGYTDPRGTKIISAVYGAVMGGISGYVSALAIGGNWIDATAAAASGVVVGAVSGFGLPDSIPGAMAASAAGAAAGDFMGQLLANNTKNPANPEAINGGEVVGAGIGGALAGLAPGEEIGAIIVSGELGFMGGTAGAGIGKALGADNGTGNQCH